VSVAPAVDGSVKMGKGSTGVPAVKWLRLATALTVLAGGGCVGPSQELFARIQPGATTREEVVELLGPPTISEPGALIYLGRDGRQAVIRFNEQQAVTHTQWWPPPQPVGERAERMETRSKTGRGATGPTSP